MHQPQKLHPSKTPLHLKHRHKESFWSRNYTSSFMSPLRFELMVARQETVYDLKGKKMSLRDHGDHVP